MGKMARAESRAKKDQQGSKPPGQLGTGAGHKKLTCQDKAPMSSVTAVEGKCLTRGKNPGKFAHTKDGI